MNTKFDFAGKVAFITGGVSGIGLATSIAFLQAGAKVIACGLTANELKAARDNPDLKGAEIEALDVTDKAAVDALIAKQARLDFVVNCAGIIRRDQEHIPEKFDEVLDVHVSGSMRVSTAARPLLKETNGSIVMIGSVMTFFGGPAQPAYSSSKGALRNLTMSLAGAYAADGIRVNGVAPGWILTELSRGARENPERNAHIMGRIAMDRWAETSEVAAPILFLCSDAASYVTGTMLTVDGGYTSIG
jgi:NAD(P)-dependent dehydrogenase (short-subunit alcohol dehydrogenase family)